MARVILLIICATVVFAIIIVILILIRIDVILYSHYLKLLAKRIIGVK